MPRGRGPAPRRGVGSSSQGSSRAGSIANASGLAPGSEIAYRVRRGGVPVFEARACARKVAGQPHRFVAFGDGGADTSEQKAVAYQAFLARPDFVMLTGDLVYFKGRITEYLDKFFPIYNAGRPSPRSGAPSCARRSSWSRPATTT